MKIDTNTEQGLANENVFILNTFAFSSDGRFFYYFISEKRQIDVHFCLIAFFYLHVAVFVLFLYNRPTIIV